MKEGRDGTAKWQWWPWRWNGRKNVADYNRTLHILHTLSVRLCFISVYIYASSTSGCLSGRIIAEHFQQRTEVLVEITLQRQAALFDYPLNHFFLLLSLYVSAEKREKICKIWRALKLKKIVWANANKHNGCAVALSVTPICTQTIFTRTLRPSSSANLSAPLALFALLRTAHALTVHLSDFKASQISRSK